MSAVINYQNVDYKIGKEIINISSTNSQALLLYIEYVENGLYKPRHDIALHFAVEDYTKWKDDNVIFSLEINGEKYSVTRKNVGDGIYIIEETGSRAEIHGPHNYSFNIVIDK